MLQGGANYVSRHTNCIGRRQHTHRHDCGSCAKHRRDNRAVGRSARHGINKQTVAALHSRLRPSEGQQTRRVAQKGTPERMGDVVLTYKTRICVYKCKNMGVMAHFVQLQHKIHDKNVAYEK